MTETPLKTLACVACGKPQRVALSVERVWCPLHQNQQPPTPLAAAGKQAQAQSLARCLQSHVDELHTAIRHHDDIATWARLMDIAHDVDALKALCPPHPSHV